uniref:Uncharacterized protein n=1 Tax=Octopus bimaculoides TaxID=37653 RepID=A0A0L8I8D3_OCTBM
MRRGHELAQVTKIFTLRAYNIGCINSNELDYLATTECQVKNDQPAFCIRKKQLFLGYPVSF